MLEITHVSKRFAHLQALGDLSLHLADGELVGLVGANGSGKSTTMRIIMGVLDSGTVTWRGSPVDARVRRRIGYMPEERGLYPRMRVREQLIYLARLHGVPAPGGSCGSGQSAWDWSSGAATRFRRYPWATSSASSWPPPWWACPIPSGRSARAPTPLP